MTEQEAAQTDEAAQPEASQEEAGMAGAVDDRAAELTGAQGAAQTDSLIAGADNRGAVAQAEEHLEDANLADDRETLKKLQGNM